MVQQQVVGDTNKRWMAAARAGDAAALAALYTEDAILLPPGVEPLHGRTAIEAFFKAGIEMGIRDATLETVEEEYFGDVAHEVGAYTMEIAPAGGQAMTDKGAYVVIWKREADGWKLRVDIWRSNAPAPA
jgi:uncharacterized protein (TIGR02246 family)